VDYLLLLLHLRRHLHHLLKREGVHQYLCLQDFLDHILQHRDLENIQMKNHHLLILQQLLQLFLGVHHHLHLHHM
tara:strand:- start:259 stop:483 length:225 start_codon:yes stop_codon:yes gene_type:complete